MSNNAVPHQIHEPHGNSLGWWRGHRTRVHLPLFPPLPHPHHPALGNTYCDLWHHSHLLELCLPLIVTNTITFTLQLVFVLQKRVSRRKTKEWHRLWTTMQHDTFHDYWFVFTEHRHNTFMFFFFPLNNYSKFNLFSKFCFYLFSKFN